MENKVRDLDYEVKTLKEKQEKQEKQFADFQESVKKSLEHIDSSVEKMADVFQKLSDIDHKFDLLEKETNHQDTLIHGKIKGMQKLTQKDVDTLSEAFKETTESLKKMTWTVVAAIASVVGSIVLKQLGVL